MWVEKSADMWVDKMDVSSVVNSVELKGMKLVDLKAAEWVGSWAVCWAFLRADRRAAMMAVLMAVLTAERKDVK